MRLLVILLLLVAWQAWVIANSFNPIVMPTPIAVLNDLVTNPGVYLGNVGITLLIAFFGLVAGMLVGTGLAVAAWFSPIASGLLNPLTVPALIRSATSGGEREMPRWVPIGFVLGFGFLFSSEHPYECGPASL